jgi:chromosome segregation ATPase
MNMNIDERLDRLTERHEALAESLQLLTADVQSLAQSVKEHDRVLRGHADLIGDLARIASVHEQRIGRLEGRQG